MLRPILMLLRWKLEIQEVLKNRWFHRIFQIAIVGVWLYWYRHVPLPGKALIALTIAAALMSLDIAPMQRIVWLVLVLGMAFMESRAIDRDRAQFVKDQKTFSDTQARHFDDIGSGIKAAITESQQQFKATMQQTDILNARSAQIANLSEKSINDITGGKTYCFVIASPIGNEFLLILNTVGRSPLHEVTVDQVDIDLEHDLLKPGTGLDLNTLQRFTTSYPSVPFLSSTSGRQLGRIPMGTNEGRNLHFNFFSMNGVWGEDLKLRLVDGRWTQAIRVTKEINSPKGIQHKMIYSMVPPGYPKVNGKVDW